MKSPHIHLIPCACGIGASMRGCEDAPTYLKNSAFLRSANLPLLWHKPHVALGDATNMAALPAIADLANSIAKDLYQVVKEQQPFLVLGGDQSCSFGTWSGVSAAVQETGGSLGLIWIDAHMDSHTPETTESGNLHGMPLAALMHYGASELTNVFSKNAKLSPNNVCLIGVRSYEKGEADLLARLGVRIYFMDEVKKRGVAIVMKEALAIVTQNTSAFGVALDVDSVTPSDAPGVGTPVADGIKAAELIPALISTVQHANYIGAEIVEFNPSQDRDQKTERLVVEFMAVLTKARIT